jgi:hypothetical protein
LAEKHRACLDAVPDLGLSESRWSRVGSHWGSKYRLWLLVDDLGLRSRVDHLRSRLNENWSLGDAGWSGEDASGWSVTDRGLGLSLNPVTSRADDGRDRDRERDGQNTEPLHPIGPFNQRHTYP